jgi:hypothetical protein
VRLFLLIIHNGICGYVFLFEAKRFTILDVTMRWFVFNFFIVENVGNLDIGIVGLFLLIVHKGIGGYRCHFGTQPDSPTESPLFWHDPNLVRHDILRARAGPTR